MTEAHKLAVIMGRKEHAARINEAWQKTVDGAVETGLRIIDAREALAHGEYIAMVESDLNFSRSMAFRFVAIASNKVLSNDAHVQHLPAAVGTLYDLTVIANKGYDLEAGIQGGAIHPRMERKDVKALLPSPQRYDDLEETEPDPEDEAGAEAEVFITDEQGRRRRLQEGELEAMVAKGHKQVMTVWREIECFTDALIDADAKLAQRLFAILRDDVDIEGRGARDVLTEALEFGLKLATQRAPRIEDVTPTDQGAADQPSEVTPKKRGRPKGSKNKPKAVEEPISETATDQDATADIQNHAQASPNDDLGIPEFLRRTAAAP